MIFSKLFSIFSGEKDAVVDQTTISGKLYKFVNSKMLPGTDITEKEFWDGFVKAANDAAGADSISRIIDAECGKNLASSVEIIAPKGTILGYGSVLQPMPELPFMNMMFKHVTLSTILVYLLDDDEAAAYAAIIFDMLERRLLDVPVEGRFTLDDAAAAHELVEAGQRRGAVVLEID